MSTTRNGSFFTSRWARATCAETNRASERASSVCQALSSGLFSASYCRGLLLRATCTQTPSLCTKTTQKQKTARPRIRFVSHKADAKRFPSPIPTTTTCRGRPTLVSAQSLRKKSGQTHTHKNKTNKQTNMFSAQSGVSLWFAFRVARFYLFFYWFPCCPSLPPLRGRGGAVGTARETGRLCHLIVADCKQKERKDNHTTLFPYPLKGH